MSIPSEVTHDHVLAAMERLGPDSSKWPRNRRSVHYEVIHPDPLKRWRMPPKLVMSVAVQIATGFELPPSKFSGGDEVNRRLTRLGYQIIDRRRP